MVPNCTEKSDYPLAAEILLSVKTLYFDKGWQFSTLSLVDSNKFVFMEGDELELSVFNNYPINIKVTYCHSSCGENRKQIIKTDSDDLGVDIEWTPEIEIRPLKDQKLNINVVNPESGKLLCSETFYFGVIDDIIKLKTNISECAND
uniref:Uncharacterized protein n=1 Tax=Pithovirus LCPAC201 TaxID=2506591 RepID=A0A481Z7A9_9VIRU|nr:MAG: hypothetical protein LCPAC201_03200 [Pithovirus LCPAC201]